MRTGQSPEDRTGWASARRRVIGWSGVIVRAASRRPDPARLGWEVSSDLRSAARHRVPRGRCGPRSRRPHLRIIASDPERNGAKATTHPEGASFVEGLDQGHRKGCGGDGAPGHSSLGRRDAGSGRIAVIGGSPHTYGAGSGRRDAEFRAGPLTPVMISDEQRQTHSGPLSNKELLLTGVTGSVGSDTCEARRRRPLRAFGAGGRAGAYPAWRGLCRGGPGSRIPRR